MRHRASMRCRVLLACTCLASFGCGEDVAFLPLDELCPELASDVCEARDPCCNQPDLDACVAVEKARCDAAVAAFTLESSLRYDSVQAARQRGALRDSLEACGLSPSYAPFFEGGLGLGVPCERDAQCASGLCGGEVGEPRLCREAPPVPLCSAP